MGCKWDKFKTSVHETGSKQNGNCGHPSISSQGNDPTKQTHGTQNDRIDIKPVFQCGNTASPSTRNLPAGNFIDCRKVPLRDSMRDVLKWAKCSSSVCQIRFSNRTATGFRVGFKHVMTALHVVKAIIKTMAPRNEVNNYNDKVALLRHRNVKCIFDYVEENNFENVKEYYFEPVVHFANEETDTAVLELAAKSDGSQMPPALDQFGCPEVTDKFTFIGHEGSAMQRNTVDIIIDKENLTTKEDIRYVKQYNDSQTRNNYEFEPYSTLTNESRVLFHCKFSKGASGSPGIAVLEDGTVVVVTMLLCGYPNWYYDENVDRQLRSQWPKEYCIEQGANMASVGRIMSIENPSLYEEIFRSSLPEPFL